MTSSHLFALLATAAAAAALVPAPAAHAAASPINCDASALNLTIGTAPAFEPATANRGSSACLPAASPSQVDLTGIPLSAGVIAASTTGGGENEGQRGLAQGGIANLKLAALPNLGLPDLSSQVPTIAPVAIPLTAPLSTLIGSSSISVDITGAVKDLAQGIALPDTSLLSVGAATAIAGASCATGTPVRTGLPQFADVTVLGQPVGADGLVSDSIEAIGAQSIDLSQLDVTKVTLPDAVTKLGLPQATLTLLQNLIAPVVHALPPVQIPAQLAQVQIVPGTQSDLGGILTQHALDVHVALLGQTLLDGYIGEARVNTRNVDCGAPATTTSTPVADATALTLQCTKRSLVLTDVLTRNGRVRLTGAADKKLAGKSVAIKFSATGRRVATARIKPDGSFTTTASLPKKSLRHSNKARYKAVLGSKSSLDLKLARRMIVTSMSSRAGTVTIKGHVTRPLGRPVQKVKVQRRVSCKRNETVKSVSPKADGSFAVTVDAPTGQTAAVYRLATKVRNNEHSRKLFDTFTLPRGINLRQ